MGTKTATKSDGTDKKSLKHVVDALLERAMACSASDIHFEPSERTVRVRFRIDGLLEQVTKLPPAQYPALVAYFKHWAGLSNKLEAPQSSTVEYDSKFLSATLTVSTMPTIDGEKVVVHISPQLSEPATLESLGLWGESLQRIEHVVAEPHGLVVASSPTAAGASMTLLGIVHLLNNPALNIATLEDPITQRIASVNQTEVR
ncbi:MAG TPA: ATPase, T2SS/T4P/T4SS family, partial [Nitrososphaera sp.]|nr:ATPase, T2SS/T4P/T4SS family [Nitrososphaera sp.]